MLKLLVPGCAILLVLVGAIAYQKRVEDDKNGEAKDHAAVAAMIQSAEADGAAAGELLQQYVATGDVSLLPEMQAKTDSGVLQLTTAINEAGGDPGGFVQQGAALVAASGQVVALKQTGDTEGAVAALTELSATYAAFIDTQDQFIASEQAQAAAAEADADEAGDSAVWLAAAAAVIGLAVVGGTLIGVLRRGRNAAPEAQPS